MGTTSSLRWILDPLRTHWSKCLEEHWFSSARSITYQTLRLWPATNQRYGRVYCRRQMWFDSATTAPRCCKQRCFVAWPELDSSVPIRHQRTTLYAKGVGGATFRRDVHTVGVPTDLDLKKVIADHPNIFAPGLGLCTKTKAHLQLRDGVQPKFLKARPVPFSRRDAVKKDFNGWRI